jgi:hypothetical protein
LVSAYGSDEEGRPAAKADYCGEDLYELQAQVKTAGAEERSGDYRVIYEVPTAELVSRQLTVLRSKRPDNCLGMILFRYPEPAEISTVPLSAIAAAIQGKPAAPQLRVHVNYRQAPWEGIEGPSASQSRPVDVTVSVTNSGTSSTFIARDALLLTLVVDRAAIEDITATGADGIETLFQPPAASGASATALRAGMARANVVRMQRIYLAAGETQALATLRLRAGAGATIRGTWSARCPGGYDSVTGTLSPVKLQP